MGTSILDPFLFPLLNLPPFYSILIVSIFLSVLITLIYKYTTDQQEMKRLRAKLKEYQKQMKELRSQPDEMMKVQKKAMEMNMQYMKMSMKPMLFTFIPIILIFGWLGAHFGFEPIAPDEPFNVSVSLAEEYAGDVMLSVGNQPVQIIEQQRGNASQHWRLKAEEGIYALTFSAGDVEREKRVRVTEKRNYEKPTASFGEGPIEKITVHQDKIHPLHGTPLEHIPWVGNFGWLGTYIIFSLIFSISLRKLLKLS